MRRHSNKNSYRSKKFLILLYLCLLPVGFSCENKEAGLEQSVNYEISNRAGEVTKCATAKEGSRIVLSCPAGQTIDSIVFASYGTPEGTCVNGFKIGSCHGANSQGKVEKLCRGKQSCTLNATNGFFGDPCVGTYKRLYIQYTCSGGGDNGGDDNGGGGSEAVLPYKERFNDEGGSFKCSKNTCTWISKKIVTSHVSKLKITADARSYVLGQFESADYLELFYRIDGGSWKSFFRHTDDLKASTVIHSLSNNGDIIEIQIRAKTSAKNETYEVDNLTVQGDGDNTDLCPNDPNKTEPGDCGCGVPEGNCVAEEWLCSREYFGTGDGCDCGCGVPDPDCNGRGCTESACSNSACDAYHARCPSGQKCFIVTEKYGGKWADVEKSPNVSADDLFCWVAGPTNILDWSGWGNVNGFKDTDDIFLYAQKYWPRNNDDGPYDSGDDAYDMLEWFFLGDQSDEDFPAGGGFHKDVDFPGYCGGDLGDDLYVGICPKDMENDPKAIMELLDAGYAAAIQMKGDEGGDDGGHVITLWGYSVDKNNPNTMTGVFLTDSDDDKRSTNPPDRIFWREVWYDGVWHILDENGKPYKYIKYLYGLKQK